MHAQCKNIGCTVIYKKGKIKYKQKTKKKKVSIVATWYCSYCSKKKKNVSLHQYLKEKKNTNQLLKEKKKATVPIE